MVGKVLKIYMGFVFVALVSVIVMSCCRPKNVKTCGITVSPNIYAYSPSDLGALNINPEDNIDTSFGQFYFDLRGTNIFEEDVCYLNIPFISSAYAFQPCENRLIDSIPRANLSISLNRDIVFDGQTILAGQNLMTNSVSANYMKYSYNTFGSYHGRIFIDSLDYPLMQFDTGLYTLTTTTTTTSGHTDIQMNNVLFKQ